jgi:hypothetical protein
VLLEYKKVSFSVADPRCLSRIRHFSIPHPGSEFFPSRIRIKQFQYFKAKKCFLSSRKYDPGCSSRISDPDPDFLPIPDPGVKKAPDPGAGSATLVSFECGHFKIFFLFNFLSTYADILHGSVGILNNYNLCHIKTIQWDEIITGNNAKYVYVYNFTEPERDCTPCHEACEVIDTTIMQHS